MWLEVCIPYTILTTWPRVDMLTPEQFLLKIHEIAASTDPEGFEDAVRQKCVLLAREIEQEETRSENEPDPDPDC